MKTLIFVLVVLVATFIGFAPLLPESRIEISSEVPVKPEAFFYKVGNLYLTYFTKSNVEMERCFMGLRVKYLPRPIMNAKFKDGIRGVTEDGFTLNSLASTDEVIVVNASYKDWDIFRDLFLTMKNKGILSDVERFEVYKGKVAFFDKKGILIVVGQEKPEIAFMKLNKAQEFLKEPFKSGLVIDLQYKNECVIFWR